MLHHGPGYVLYALMDAVVDRYFPVLDGLERVGRRRRTDLCQSGGAGQIEDALLFEAEIDDAQTRCGAAAGGDQQAIRRPRAQHCAGLHDYFRDVYDHLLRLNQSIDSMRDMVSTAISVNLSLITLQESEVTKRLAAYAALVAVPTMIVGVYGMNFDHMPELRSPLGYPANPRRDGHLRWLSVLSFPQGQMALGRIMRRQRITCEPSEATCENRLQFKVQSLSRAPRGI